MHTTDEDIWQTHSMKFLESAFRTDRREKLAHADGHGKQTGECGDTVEFFLLIQDERLEHISYDINGCINTNACANAIVDLVKGKRLAEAWDLDPEDVQTILKPFPKTIFIARNSQPERSIWPWPMPAKSKNHPGKSCITRKHYAERKKPMVSSAICLRHDASPEKQSVLSFLSYLTRQSHCLAMLFINLDRISRLFTRRLTGIMFIVYLAIIQYHWCSAIVRSLFFIEQSMCQAPDWHPYKL
jgi:nitrogen fixation NifU-like protein